MQRTAIWNLLVLSLLLQAPSLVAQDTAFRFDSPYPSLQQSRQLFASAGLSALLDSVRSRLHERHSVETMAAEIHVSPRTLARRFETTFGIAPHRWLTRERVFLAQQLLESSDDPIERIADRCGFGSAQLLRLHFRRLVGTTPSAYRASFRAEHTR